MWKYISFRVGTLLLLLWSFRWGAPEVFSFDRFKVWTTQENLKLWHSEFLKSTLVDDAVVALALANMRVANDQYHTTPEIGSVFQSMKVARTLVSVNIMDLLKSDRTTNEQNLDAHIRHLALTLDKSTNSVASLQEKSTALIQEAQSCLDAKRAGDQQFFKGVQEWQDADTQQWLATSLEYAPCYITKRIESNAYAYMANMLSASLSLLSQRYQLLTSQRDMILQYNGLFEWSLLEELQLLKAKITAITIPDEAQVEQVFSFRNIVDTNNIPTYNNAIFFPGGKIPTFQNPGVQLSK